jgi:hypothetical protein
MDKELPEGELADYYTLFVLFRNIVLAMDEELPEDEPPLPDYLIFVLFRDIILATDEQLPEDKPLLPYYYA